MRKVRLLLLALFAMAGVSPAAAVAAESIPGLTAAPTVVPPALQALEQKLDELKITSMRFSLRTSITLPANERKLKKLLELFGGGSNVSGEETISPPAANLTLEFFGHPFTLRVVGKASYLYLPQPAFTARDGGRPWVGLGSEGLGALITVNGRPLKQSSKTPKSSPGPLGVTEPHLGHLSDLLAKAREIRELGVGTLDGQPVTRFLAVFEPEALKREPLASISLRLPPDRPSLPPPSETVEVAFAANGLPVQLVIEQSDGGVASVATLDISAINFPLTVAAPPASQTINVKQLLAIERRLKARRRHGRRSKRRRSSA